MQEIAEHFGVHDWIASRSLCALDNLFDRAYAHAVNRASMDPFNRGPVQVNELGRQLWGARVP